MPVRDVTASLATARRRRADQARLVADVLRQQVLGGAFAGGTLPAETALVREFDTTRNTVREALDLLRDEGLVERVPGLGTSVAGRKYPHGLNLLLGLGGTLGGHGAVTNEVRAAAAGLVELAEILVPDARLRDALEAARGSTDPDVRACAVDVFRATRLGDPSTFEATLADEAAHVRVAAVRGLVFVGGHAAAAAAAGDPEVEVRLSVAHGLGAIGRPDGTAAATLLRLALDPEPLVRAAALEAAARSGAVPDLAAAATAAAADDPVWQVRRGAALALAPAAAGGPPAPYVGLLIALLRDENADVRKAAAALAHARDDSDADVRALAHRACAPATPS